MAATTLTLTQVGKTEVRGATKVTVWDMDVTVYNTTDNIDLTPANLKLKKISHLEITPRENGYMPVWNGSLTAPEVTLRGGAASGAELAEIADQTDAGVFRIVAYGK